LTRNFEKISQEVQLHQGDTHKEAPYFDISVTPPLRTSHMTKINYDEQLVGHRKECHNVIGKITSNSSNKSEIKIEQNFLGEDPAHSIYQEGCIGSKDKKKIHNQNSLPIVSNKKSSKNIKKLQPIASPEEHGLNIPIANGHEKQKIGLTWDSNTMVSSTSNTLGI